MTTVRDIFSFWRKMKIWALFILISSAGLTASTAAIIKSRIDTYNIASKELRKSQTNINVKECVFLESQESEEIHILLNYKVSENQ